MTVNSVETKPDREAGSLPGDNFELKAPARLQPLLAGEQRAINLLKERKAIDLTENQRSIDDPLAAASWGEDRQLRGVFVSWLATEAQLQK
jgi:hypothetical protein